MLFNAKQLDYEVHNQTNQFLKDFDFEEYICNKKMISSYSDGKLRGKIFYKKYESTQSTLDIIDDFKMF